LWDIFSREFWAAITFSMGWDDLTDQTNQTNTNSLKIQLKKNSIFNICLLFLKIEYNDFEKLKHSSFYIP
jgi:hypothetical protein